MSDKSRTILVVEDQYIVVLAERELLIREGYEVVHVSTGQEAVAEVSNREDIDLVLMDIHLDGEMNGIEAAQRILEIRDIPLMFLSSHVEPEIVERAESVASYGYLVKGTSDTVFLASIRMAFRLFEARRQAERREQELRRAERRSVAFLQSVLDALPATVAVLDESGAIVAVNESWRRFARDNDLSWDDYGVGRAYLGPLTDGSDEPQAEAESSQDMIRCVIDGEREEVSFIMPCHSEQEKRWFVTEAQAFKHDRRRWVVVSHTSVTAEVEERRRATTLLAQRELLLRETHHRVKNHLGALSGLLSLQALQSDGEQTRSALQDASSRTRSMSLLYDRLYHGEAGESVNAREYLEPLIEGTLELLASQGVITSSADICDIRLDSGVLAPLGLILSELITNSVKYAFPAGHGEKTIRISLTTDRSGVRFVYADSGIGMPAAETSSESTSFGVQLIRMLAEQMGGTVEIGDSDAAFGAGSSGDADAGGGGTCYTIHIPNESVSPAYRS